MKETLNQTTGALTAASEAQTKANLAETRASELASEMGIKYRDIEQAVLGNAAAQERVSAGMTKHWEENAVTLNESNDALNSWSASAVNARSRNKQLTEIIEEQRAAIEEAQQAKRDAIQADREAAAAMGEAARSNRRFNDALEVARDITQDAETRVRALKQALDELKGGAISAEEAQKRLSETNLSLAEGLAQSDEAGTKLWQSTLDGAGAVSYTHLDVYKRQTLHDHLTLRSTTMPTTAQEINGNLVIDFGDGTTFTIYPVPGSVGIEIQALLVGVALGVTMHEQGTDAVMEKTDRLTKLALGAPTDAAPRRFRKKAPNAREQAAAQRLSLIHI